MEPESEGFFKNLFKYGKLPTVETTVEIEQGSIYTAAAALFIAAFLIILTWYTFKKIS